MDKENKAKLGDLRQFIRYVDLSLNQLRKQANIGEIGEAEYIRDSIMQLDLECDYDCEIVRDIFNELAFRIILENRYKILDNNK